MGLIAYTSEELQALLQNLSLDAKYLQNNVSNVNYYFTSVYGVIFLAGIFGNAWVAYVIACVFCCDRTPRNSDIDHHRGQRATYWFRANFWRAPGARTSFHPASSAARAVQFYISSLCACDLIILTFLLCVIADLLYGEWPFDSPFLCRVYLASEGLNKFCIPFLLVSLSGYCYVTIAQYEVSTVATAKQSLPGTPFSLAFLCLVAGLALASPMYYFSELQYLILYNDTTEDFIAIMRKCVFIPPDTVLAVFTAYSFVLGYLLPAVLFTCFYSSVLHVVYKRSLITKGNLRKNCATVANATDSAASTPHANATFTFSNSNSHPRASANASTQSKSAHSKRRRAHSYLSSVAKTTLSLIAFYLLSWTPYWTMNLYHYLSAQALPPGYVQIAYIVHMLPYLNSGYPIVYTVMNKNIKETYKRIRAERTRSRASVHGAAEQRQSSMLAPNEKLLNASPTTQDYGLQKSSFGCLEPGDATTFSMGSVTFVECTSALDNSVNSATRSEQETAMLSNWFA